MDGGRHTDPRAQSAARRWGFLNDWLVLLQAHLSYNEQEEADEVSMHSKLKNLCVYLPRPPQSTQVYRQELLRLREALELVGLMLEMDKYAWLLIGDPERKTLEGFDPNDYNDDDLRPHFLFKAYKRNKKDAGDGVASIAALARLLAVVDPNEFSYAYERARRRILNEMDDRGLLHGFRISITLIFNPVTMPATRIPQYLAQAKTLVTTIRSQNVQPADHNEYPFKLQHVIVHPWDFRVCRDPEGNDVRGLVTHILDQGVHIPEVAIQLNSPGVRALGKLLHTVTHTHATPLRRPHSATIDSIVITDSLLTAFICVCSALASSSTLTRLHTYEIFEDHVDGNRAEKWKWLGYALLSRASTSSVQELYIEEQKLTLSDVEALASSALSPHPIQELSSLDYDGDALDDADENDEDVAEPPRRKYNPVDRQVQLAQDAKVRLFSVEGKDRKLSSLCATTSTYFPVVTDDTESEWMEVLIPGYGCAWVPCESIVDVAAIKMDPERRPQRLKTLSLNFNQCERGALAAMIRTAGASLVVLNISSKKSEFVRSDDVLTILDSCPNLKMLRLLCAKIGTMHHFTRAYEEDRCRITSLSLVNVEVSNASLCSVAQVLADPAHPMTKTLTEFRYHYDVLGCPGDLHRPDRRGIQLFLEMLKTNRTLSFFEIALADDLHDRYARRFENLDRRRYTSSPAHVPLRSKLALLSCVTVVADNQIKRLRRSRGDSRDPALSRGIVARIFEFARRRMVRNVSIAEVTDTPAAESNDI